MDRGEAQRRHVRPRVRALGGGGFSVTNAESHLEVLERMADYPLFGMVTWDVRPLLEFADGGEMIRAKLAQAQATMGAH